MLKILSVVIPTYNMEKYLENCLDSFIYDEKAEDLEVLIVNDGSKDNSLSIARRYEEKFPNIFKVIDKENGGHGSTINAGLKVAKGKYFKVVDADDWVDTEELKKLLEFLYKNDVDCIISNYVHFYEFTNKYLTENCMIIEPFVIKDINDVKNFRFTMHSFVFSTEKIRNVRLQEKCFYVDVEYNIYSYAQCENVVCLPINLYQYRLGRAGQSVSPEGLYKHRDNHFTVVKNIISFYETNKEQISPVKKDNIFKHVTVIARAHYEYHNLMSYSHPEVLQELKQYDEWLKQYPEIYQEVLSSKIVKSFRKNDFKVLRFNRLIYKLKGIVKKILRRG